MNGNNETPCAPHPFAMLPGDPSLILTTNVDLGEKKLEIMKGKQAPPMWGDGEAMCAIFSAGCSYNEVGCICCSVYLVPFLVSLFQGH